MNERMNGRTNKTANVIFSVCSRCGNYDNGECTCKNLIFISVSADGFACGGFKEESEPLTQSNKQ